MKQWLKKRKARGFTLVELLIVIVIIGILAGSLLLVMGSGTDKANATKIASNLRTIKAAELMYYADEGKFKDIPNVGSDDEIVKYLDRKVNDPLGKYSVETGKGTESGDYYVVFKKDGGTATQGVLAILGKMEGVEVLSADKEYGSRIGR